MVTSILFLRQQLKHRSQGQDHQIGSKWPWHQPHQANFHYRHKLADLIEQFEDILSLHLLDCEEAEGFVHRIHLTDDRPLCIPYHRVPPAHYQKICQVLSDMKERGIKLSTYNLILNTSQAQGIWWLRHWVVSPFHHLSVRNRCRNHRAGWLKKPTELK